MLDHRTSGILLHPTSLPGPYGMGDLGDSAYAFVDYLVRAGQKRWQILPLGPTGFGDSPYASFSSFAGNPMLLSLDKLAAAGDLEASDIEVSEPFSERQVDYGRVIDWKMPRLRKAAANFLKSAPAFRKDAYKAFSESESDWLDEYALFMALKAHFDEKARAENFWGAMWNNYWDKDIALRDPAALAKARVEHADEIEIQKVLQFYFFEQWMALKAYANEREILIIGDLPIFVSLDSADVWSSPSEFRLDENAQPVLVAGVPPDYFSETGQRWGNPVYNWEVMEKNKFAWWIKRFAGTRKLVDIIRVDHFRGFEACWSIPADQPTAEKGEWIKAPGMQLFSEVKKQLGDLPILAEDLGLITMEVEALRDTNALPGMRVIQFAFDNAEDRSSIFLPHNHIQNCVVYTGTHDNDTSVGWFEKRTPEEKASVAEYIGHEIKDPAWDFIRLAMASVGGLAIVPMQDVLSLGSEARMNTPAVGSGNWAWRMTEDDLKGNTAERLKRLAKTYDRL